MIIDDEDPASPTKNDHRVLAETQDGPEDVPPPAYTGRSTPHIVPVHDPQTGPNRPLLDPETAQLGKGELAGKRFLKAFAVAALIWVLIVILTRGAIGFSHYTVRDGVPHYSKRPTKLLPKDGKVLECRSGQDRWTEHSGPTYSMTFEMTIPTEGFYLFARGAYASGHVAVVHATDWTLRDTIKIEIEAATSLSNNLNEVSVCRMERKKGERGIALLSPDSFTNHYGKPDLTWALKVQLPPSTDFSPLYFPAFETILPRFTQTIDDMHDDVIFGFLGLASTNGRIYADSVLAEVIELLTSNGGIEGIFIAYHLEIAASNQPIRANVTVLKDDNDNGTLLLKSSNGEIDATVVLYDPNPASDAGTFDVLVRTTNAALELRVIDLPIGADAHIMARTSNGAATLHLPHTFEGGFQVLAASALQDVKFDDSLRDPSGRGRKRGLSMEKVGKCRWIGTVGWVDLGVSGKDRLHRGQGQGSREVRRREVARERQHQYLQLIQDLEEERRRDAGAQTDSEPIDGYAWELSQRGQHLNSSALLATMNGPAVLDLT